MEDSPIILWMFIAGALGFISAAIASGNGHSFGAWWLFGAALLIVALPWPA